MADPTSEFATLLSAFASHVELVWAQYEARGPGKVDAALAEPIGPLVPQLGALLDGQRPGGSLQEVSLPDVDLLDDVQRAALAAAIRQAADLAQRCATLPQGLCFVSGEAGLVPRRDQLEAFTAARADLRAALDRLSSAS